MVNCFSFAAWLMGSWMLITTVAAQLEVSTGRRLQRSCGDREVPPCRVRAPRDLVFLLDASDSIDPARFYGPMLDYIQELWCSLDTSDLNRGAVISFGQTVKTLVDLKEYNQEQWFSAIETVREDASVCCACCTPTAEAFRQARLMLTNNPSPDVSGVPVVRIVFVITDGDPWQNKNPLAGKPGLVLDRKDYWLWPEYSAAEYRYTIVPEEAYKLKKMDSGRDVRIMLIGVPNKHGAAPEQGYFSGKPDPKLGKGFTQCIKRGARKRQCVVMRFPPFPIISLPIEKNLFNPSTWDVGELIEETVDDLCEVLPTPQPTLQPTTRAPSGQPSVAPTPRPTFLPSRSPTGKPSLAPTGTPTHSPTKPPTLGPSRAPTFHPTGSPSRRPSRAPTFRPSHSPSKAPTTTAPSLAPTEKEQFDGLDLFVFVDRSRSMRWRASSCRRAPGSNPVADDDHVCWELFLFFVEQLVIRSTKLKYDGVREIGWQDNMFDKTKGLRVWIYGFACTGGQKVPIVEKIGERINSLESFQTAMFKARSLLPDGGTCPGAAIERSIGMIMANDLLERPYKASLLLTDGVFYDQPNPEIAAKGLHYFGVLTYALGIAIPEQGNNQGLTPKEIQDQRKQLLAFVRNDRSRLINLGADGINVLESIAQSFVDRLPIDVAKAYPRVLKKPYWCGFTNNERCLNTEPDTFPTAQFCRWIPNNPKNFEGNGRCEDRCPYTKKGKCEKDHICEWAGGGFCRPKILA